MTNYLFFTAWTKAREKMIADETDFERMIKARNLDESFRVLQDTDYSPYSSNTNSSCYEDVFIEERKELKKLVEKMGMDEKFLSLFFDDYDLPILRKILKKEEKNPESKEILPPIELFTDTRVIEKKYEKELINFKKNIHPEGIDDYLTECLIRKKIKILSGLKEKKIKFFLKKYFEKIKIDKDRKRVEKELKKMEDDFIEEGERRSDGGLMPIFTFFLKKRRVEKILRTIFSAKEISLKEDKIKEIISEIRAL